MIVAIREETGARLTQLGFKVLPSRTNFLLARPPELSAEQWLKRLRDRKILVRWFSESEVRGYLRITIVAPHEMECLIQAARRILSGLS